MLKKIGFVSIALFIFGFSATLMGNEWANYYFPDTVGSYWTYEDQDGNELTRYAVEPEEVDGETYRAFSYEPTIDNWADFKYHVQPYFYQTRNEWVAFFAGTEIENAFKAVKSEEMEKIILLSREQILQEVPEGLNINLDIDYDVEVESQDYFYLLPTPASFNEEWTALELDIIVSMTMDFGMPEIPGGSEQTVKNYTTLVETGNVTSTETVETAAGTFEDCLRIEYRTDASTKIVAPEVAAELGGIEPEIQEQKDVSLTVLWLAPNVGIVKCVHKRELSEVEIELGLEPPEEKTLELTRYEIIPLVSQDEK
ncbi:hypothetical protein C6503_15605 [Candidatus Poribacteria bacterium]|nr:MAG: hypothetical protein C6503_15605 [Candidatus Poribacteria bacterium]